MPPTFRYERKLWRKGYKIVVGADEVGRGGWAGPVVAAAVTFARETAMQLFCYEAIRIDDSKKLTPRQREKAVRWIKKNALSWGIGEASVAQINRYGMAKASKTAFRRAIIECGRKLEVRSENSHFPPYHPVFDLLESERSRSRRPEAQTRRASHTPHHISKIDFLLIDAFYLPYTRGIRRKNQLAIINGDEKCFSIAAASILAKVWRDRLMRRLSRKHREFRWSRNKGYGTKQHQEAIRKHGLTRLHRKQFMSKIA